MGGGTALSVDSWAAGTCSRCNAKVLHSVAKVFFVAVVSSNMNVGKRVVTELRHI